MAGRMALDHVAKVRVLPGQPIGRYRLGVRTGGSQPSNRGSIPRSAIESRAALDTYKIERPERGGHRPKAPSFLRKLGAFFIDRFLVSPREPDVR